MANRPTDWHVLDLDRDPVPGDPFEVKELARKLGDFADDVSSALRSVKGLSGNNAVQDWAGLAGDAYREQFGDLPGELTKLEKSYRLASGALETYWPKLETAQADADRALAQGRTARQDLDAAKTTQGTANDWVKRAGDKSKEYQADPKPGVEPPSADEVRTATRNALDASNAQKSANTAVHDAQQRLDAAKELAAQAAHLRDTAASTAEHALHEASDAGIKNKHWWEKAVDWVADHWDDIVAVCKVIVAVLGIVVMIIGGPLAWIVLAAALVVLADTLVKYAQGKASLWDVAFAALDCIPMFKGLTTAGGLLKMAKSLPKLMKGMGSHLGDLAGAFRKGLSGLRKEGKALDGKPCELDPIDVATGDVLLVQADVSLPGVLPFLLKRVHVSSYRAGRRFGASWASTVDQRLVIDDQGVIFHAEDGSTLYYPVPVSNGMTLPVVGPQWPLAWDGTPGGPITITDIAAGHILHFDPSGPKLPPTDPQTMELPLRTLTDRNGNRIDFDHADDGSLAEIRHSAGYRVQVETTNSRITELRLLGGSDRPVLQRFAYDDAGRLIKAYGATGHPLVFSYDAEGRITGWTDRSDTAYTYSYDDQGRCVRAEGSGGFLSGSLAYDDETRTTRVTDSLGHAKTFTMNEAYQLVSETDSLGNLTLRSWDSQDRLLSLTDPLGRTTLYEYDSAGNPVTVTRPDGATATTQYNDLGLPVRVKDFDGSCWERGYDERGNLLTVTDPVRATTTYGRNDQGHLISVTDALGSTAYIDTDHAGLPVAVTDALGAVTRYQRDPDGRIARVTDAGGASTVLEWGDEGRPRRRVLPDGSAEHWEYNDEGNLVAHTDTTGSTTRYEIGHFGLVRARTEPDGSRLEFSYDTELRLTEVVNAQGLTWSYTHDEAGRVIRETDFNTRTLDYLYDASGRLVRRSPDTGPPTLYGRDELGRIVDRRTGDSITVFERDALGRIVRTTNSDAELAFELDPAGRVLSESCNGRTLTNDYDVLGRRTRRSTPSGVVGTWDFDAGHRPVSLHTAGRTLSFAHDHAGRETERHLSDTISLTHAWDANGRLVSQDLTRTDFSSSGPSAQRLLQQRAYSYRSDGRITAIEDLHTGTRRFDLDPAGRVTAVHGAGWREEYAYDAAGNLTHAAWPGESDAQGDRAFEGTLVRRAGRNHYTYDDLGRVVRRSRKLLSGGSRTWTYAWNGDNQLTSLITPDGARWRYLYDPLGRRIGKHRIAVDGTSVLERTDFTWDGTRLAERIVAGSDAGGASRITTWEWDPASHRAMTQTDRSSPRDVLDAPQDEIDERFYAIVTDSVGTPTEMVDARGHIAWRSRATVWGVPARGEHDETGAEDGSGAGADCPLRFPGQYLDTESGLHYNLHRYYAPETARYQTPDPLGLLPAPDPYAYIRNPLSWTDPLGLACDDFPIYRSPKKVDEAYERAHGPNPANHRPTPDTDGKAYFGEHSVAAEYQGIGSYADGMVRYDMDPKFLTEFEDCIHRYDWKGPGGKPRIEFAIPAARLDRFNELTRNRTWMPMSGGS
ncbi:RHS repeat-associated core domain-containing protein [Streptomyces sp. RKAG293]|uniref:RHS repeat-associated core domain-containing protein n=1 Tax=Streptomyces sp. RKAG293 TaxID=2893403 RepID=UPI00203445EE|nr:RHS repeat-associated core domain-containing protein [Streptomyces sp. RKAG293]MCM2420029.1 DUF6531 domain-containing protein [Streptomyces sp. RKAG293]